MQKKEFLNRNCPKQEMSSFKEKCLNLEKLVQLVSLQTRNNFITAKKKINNFCCNVLSQNF